MLRLFFYKNFQVLFFLFFVSNISVTAQESNLYNRMINEPLGKDFIKMNITLEADSNFHKAQRFKDIDEENFNKMCFLYDLEILLPNESLFKVKEKAPHISPYVIMFSYKNFKNQPYDTRKFNGNGTFSGEFALKGDVLMAKATHGMINISGLFSLLASQIIASTENFNAIKKETKKDKMLRTIKNDVYHVAK